MNYSTKKIFKKLAPMAMATTVLASSFLSQAEQTKAAALETANYVAQPAHIRAMQIYAEYVKDHHYDIRLKEAADETDGWDYLGPDIFQGKPTWIKMSTGVITTTDPGTADSTKYEVKTQNFAQEVHFIVTMMNFMREKNITDVTYPNGYEVGANGKSVKIKYSDVQTFARNAVVELQKEINDMRDLEAGHAGWYELVSQEADFPLMALSAGYDYLQLAGVTSFTAADKTAVKNEATALAAFIAGHEMESYNTYGTTTNKLTTYTKINTTFKDETGATFQTGSSNIGVNGPAVSAGALGLYGYHVHRVDGGTKDNYQYKDEITTMANYASQVSVGDDTHGYFTTVGSPTPAGRPDNKHHTFDLGYGSWVGMGMGMAAIGLTFLRDPATTADSFMKKGNLTFEHLANMNEDTGYFPHHYLSTKFMANGSTAADSDKAIFPTSSWINTAGADGTLNSDYVDNALTAPDFNENALYFRRDELGKKLYDNHMVPDYVVVASWGDHQGVVTAALNDGRDMRQVQTNKNQAITFGSMTAPANQATKTGQNLEGIFALIEHDINKTNLGQGTTSGAGTDANADGTDSFEAGYHRALQGLTGGMYKGLNF